MNWLVKWRHIQSAPVRTQNSPPRVGPREMGKLAFLAGEWVMKRPAPLEPHATCHTIWSGRGDYLLMHLRITPDPGPFHPSLSLIGHDQCSRVYRRWDFFPTGVAPEEWEGYFEGKQLVFTIKASDDAPADAPTDPAGQVGLMLGANPEGDESFRIDWVLPEYPAYRAGLRRGDLILKIDDQSVAGSTFEVCRECLRGPAGTSVRLVVRSGARDREVVLERWKGGAAGRREVFTPIGKREYSHALYLRRGDRYEGGDGTVFTRLR